MINICIPVLNDYSGLKECIDSIEAGTLRPDHYYILDNGRKGLNFSLSNMTVFTPPEQFSLGKAWNWFIDNVPEVRIITNDDIVFYPNTLEVFLVGMKNDTISFPYGIEKINSYSCFSMPDSIVRFVGKFDEEFFPAYFEDNSYDYRLNLKGKYVFGIPDCNIIHRGSQTLKNFNDNQMSQHHSNFKYCRDMYIKMWGGEPKHELYTTKFNR